MNKRVFNALRKIAAEPKEPWRVGKSAQYYKELPNTYPKRWSYLNDTHAIRKSLPGGGLDATIDDIRQLQARENAKLIAPFGTDTYFNINNHLRNYGRTKQYNFNNPDNPKPMPKYNGPELSPANQKYLAEAENLQANARNDRYSDVG